MLVWKGKKNWYVRGMLKGIEHWHEQGKGMERKGVGNWLMDEDGKN